MTKSQFKKAFGIVSAKIRKAFQFGKFEFDHLAYCIPNPQFQSELNVYNLAFFIEYVYACLNNFTEISETVQTEYYGSNLMHYANWDMYLKFGDSGYNPQLTKLKIYFMQPDKLNNLFFSAIATAEKYPKIYELCRMTRLGLYRVYSKMFPLACSLIYKNLIMAEIAGDYDFCQVFEPLLLENFNTSQPA